MYLYINEFTINHAMNHYNHILLFNFLLNLNNIISFIISFIIISFIINLIMVAVVSVVVFIYLLYIVLFDLIIYMSNLHFIIATEMMDLMDLLFSYYKMLIYNYLHYNYMSLLLVNILDVLYGMYYHKILSFSIQDLNFN